jgi:predicted protein tyrosine phosphatase
MGRRENERMSGKDDWPREKRWKHVYTRSAKLARAQKLGFDYPRMTGSPVVQRETSSASGGRRNVLFICSKNQWRSPTAETVWRKHPNLSVRSAGTSSTARRKVSVDDIRWADVIFVMEEKHKSRLLAEFATTVERKPLHVLDIPDEYKYMDPELVEQLQEAVAALLALE